MRRHGAARRPRHLSRATSELWSKAVGPFLINRKLLPVSSLTYLGGFDSGTSVELVRAARDGQHVRAARSLALTAASFVLVPFLSHGSRGQSCPVRASVRRVTTAGAAREDSVCRLQSLPVVGGGI